MCIRYIYPIYYLTEITSKHVLLTSLNLHKCSIKNYKNEIVCLGVLLIQNYIYIDSRKYPDMPVQMDPRQKIVIRMGHIIDDTYLSELYPAWLR